jgi:hypothetical protein
MVSLVSLFDQRIGSNAEQATASVSTEAVVVAQPVRISSGIRGSTARAARLSDQTKGSGRASVHPARLLA